MDWKKRKYPYSFYAEIELESGRIEYIEILFNKDFEWIYENEDTINEEIEYQDNWFKETIDESVYNEVHALTIKE